MNIIAETVTAYTCPLCKKIHMEQEKAEKCFKSCKKKKEKQKLQEKKEKEAAAKADYVRLNATSFEHMAELIVQNFKNIKKIEITNPRKMLGFVGSEAIHFNMNIIGNYDCYESFSDRSWVNRTKNPYITGFDLKSGGARENTNGFYTYQYSTVINIDDFPKIKKAIQLLCDEQEEFEKQIIELRDKVFELGSNDPYFIEKRDNLKEYDKIVSDKMAELKKAQDLREEFESSVNKQLRDTYIGAAHHLYHCKQAELEVKQLSFGAKLRSSTIDSSFSVNIRKMID